MSKDLNISVLVAARDEYIEKLKSTLTPLILQGFNSIYKDSLEMTNGKKTLYKFQELLKSIIEWNQTILQTEADRIKKKCNYVMDIVTAIFVSSVKILASVRLKGKNENIRVKIPTSDIFIHAIYLDAAEQIFYDPYIFYHKTNSFGQIQNNKKNAMGIIKDSIDNVIRNFLPMDDILTEFLADALDDNADIPSEDGSDSEDSIDSDESDIIQGDKIIGDDLYQESESGDTGEQFKSFNTDKHGNVSYQQAEQFQQPETQQVQQFNQPQQSEPQQVQQFNQPEQVEPMGQFNDSGSSSDSGSSYSGSGSYSGSSSGSDSDSGSSSGSSSHSRPKERHRHRHEHRKHRRSKEKYSFF